jgi:hypothetical protein
MNTGLLVRDQARDVPANRDGRHGTHGREAKRMQRTSLRDAADPPGSARCRTACSPHQRSQPCSPAARAAEAIGRGRSPPAASPERDAREVVS